MSRALLMISLGPVQEFIVQARRTRDLWYGSFLLSELSKAAARVLTREGELVFPAPDDERALVRCEEPEGAFNVANKIVALVPAARAEALAVAARDAALGELHRRASAVRQRCSDMLAESATLGSAWDEQVATFLEVHAAWAPLDGGDDSYRVARQGVETLLAARKTLREFEPWRAQRGDVPKSSLDPARETVLRKDRDIQQPPWRTYRVGPGEQLDAIGLLKRAGGRPDQFIPIANVAAAAWIQAMKADARTSASLDQLGAACQQARFAHLRRDFRWVQAFPYDAELLRAERWKAIGQEQGLAPAWFETHVRKALESFRSAPPSYVACLVADGDHMGSTLDRLGKAELHQRLSRALAQFVTRARQVVEGDHPGLLIYAGGDDVLALVCVDHALPCAQALHTAFDECVRPALPQGQAAPTLSVGIAVAHVLDNMGGLLAEGRLAEREAKFSRNAVAVRVVKRSGGTLRFRRSWNDRPVAHLDEAGQRFKMQRLSVKKVFAVRERLRRFDHGRARPDVALTEADLRALARDVWGLLRHGERTDDAFASPADAGLTFDPLMEPVPGDVPEQLEGWVNTHLVAREIERLARGPR